MRRPLPPSLYADTARSAIATPPLDGDRRVSVAVVGGGFTGLSAALHLAEKGVDVAVLEAHEPGWGASGRNGGQVNPGLKHDPDEVEAHFGPDLGRRMVELAWNAPNVVFDLARRHQITCEARQSGTLRAALTDSTAADVRRGFEQGGRRGMPVELLDRSRIAEATGTDRYLCALLDRRGGHINPLGFARGLAQAAVQAGAKVHGGTPVTRLSRNGTTWTVETPGGTVRADELYSRQTDTQTGFGLALADDRACLQRHHRHRAHPGGDRALDLSRTILPLRARPGHRLLPPGCFQPRAHGRPMSAARRDGCRRDEIPGPLRASAVATAAPLQVHPRMEWPDRRHDGPLSPYSRAALRASLFVWATMAAASPWQPRWGRSSRVG